MKVIHLSFPNDIDVAEIAVTPHVMAIGDFDGIHLGHQKVIGEAVAVAHEKGIPASIMTFNPHPREVLGQSLYSRYLAPLNKKLDLFEQLNVDYALVVHFDRAFSQVSAEDFVTKFLAALHVDTIVVGFDFRFGHRAEGNVDSLKQLCQGKQEVIVIPPFELDGHKVSSTMIREYLQSGKLSEVRKYLGRDYFVTGKVVHGDGRGRTIGFPTANIELNERYVVPKIGVYAVRCIIDGQAVFGVMNIGVRPTFHSDTEEPPRLEVHLLDYSGDLYGQTLKVEFVQFIREERKFDHIEALVNQIQDDAMTARKILGS